MKIQKFTFILIVFVSLIIGTIISVLFWFGCLIAKKYYKVEFRKIHLILIIISLIFLSLLSFPFWIGFFIYRALIRTKINEKIEIRENIGLDNNDIENDINIEL